jgi:magnesium transporter
VAVELARSPRLLKRGTAWVAHALLDHAIDNYLPLIDEFDSETETIEAEVLAGTTVEKGEAIMRRIFALKHGLHQLRRISVHQREILLRLARAEFDEIPPDAMPFFRDVYDHFVRVIDLADANKETLSNVFEVYLSVQSNRLNAVMKTLTQLSTIMLPLTFIAGVYGMNFKYMPELEWAHGYAFALGLMATVALGTVLWFRTKRWL